MPILIITALVTMAWATIHQVSAHREDIAHLSEKVSEEYIVVSVPSAIPTGTSSEFHAVYGHNE